MGCYDAAHFILSLYAAGDIGLEKLAYEFNEAGWAFRDRTGKPRRIEGDDARRVVANWPEYGGLALGRNATARPGYEEMNVDELPFNEERATFPIPLIRLVAKARQSRSVRRPDHGANVETRFFPLSGISYCFHCERVAQQWNNPLLRTRLSGFAGRKIPRYRHKPGVTCGCQNRSVPREEFERDFYKLISLLSVREEATDLMMELAIQADKH